MAETRDNSIPYTEVRVNPADFVNAPSDVLRQGTAFSEPIYGPMTLVHKEKSRLLTEAGLDKW
jgi:hypothetical protein